MSLQLKYLKWDSDFFGFRIGRIINETCSNQILFDNVRSLSEYRLIYAQNTEPIINPSKLKDFEVNHIDTKVTYLKIVEESMSIHPAISDYKNPLPSDELYKLSIESGVYSRFNLDPRIPKGKFIELYKLWIQKSLSGELADKVFVWTKGEKVVGFVTVGKKNNQAEIGIIAVDKSYRGKGIAKNLMLAAENWVYESGLTTLFVVTQKANQAANSLYSKLGFNVYSTFYVYHIWNLSVNANQISQ